MLYVVQFYVTVNSERLGKWLIHYLLPVTQSETNPVCTKLLEKEVDHLKKKKNFLESENNVLKAENDKEMKN